MSDYARVNKAPPCPVCELRHGNQSRWYLSVEDQLHNLRNLGAHVYHANAAGRGVDLSLPVTADFERVVRIVNGYRADFETYYLIQRVLARPRWGMARVLRNMRTNAKPKQVREARRLWHQEIAGSAWLGERLRREERAIRVVICRWLRLNEAINESEQKKKVMEAA